MHELKGKSVEFRGLLMGRCEPACCLSDAGDVVIEGYVTVLLAEYSGVDQSWLLFPRWQADELSASHHGRKILFWQAAYSLPRRN